MTDSPNKKTFLKGWTGPVWSLLLLRLFIGLRLLLAGIEKFERDLSYSFENYYENMGRLAEGIAGASFLPEALTKPYAHSLGYALILVGVMVLLGIKSKISLILSGLLFLSLSLGLMAVADNEGIVFLGIHVGLTCAALFLVEHSRLVIWKD